MSIKLSEYGGEYVVVNDEVEPRETLLELLEEGELNEEAKVFTVEHEPIWGHIISPERVWSMIGDYLYDELNSEEPYDHGVEDAKTALAVAMNGWAAKHLTGTVRVGTNTRIDISEMFDKVKP